MSIFKIIKRQTNIVSLSPGIDKVFDAFLDENKQEYVLLVPNNVLFDRGSLKKLFTRYYIHELFDLSNCYLGTFNERFSYWHVSKQKPEYIKMSWFYDIAHPYTDRDKRITKTTVSDKYYPNYHDYLNSLDKWIGKGDLPLSGNGKCEYVMVHYDEFEMFRPYAFYYRRANDEIRQLLRESNKKKLEEVAQVELVIPFPINGPMESARMLNSVDLTYPYDPMLNSSVGIRTTAEVHKGDIILLDKKFFLIDKESSFLLYAPPGSYVIRAKAVCAEYLYFYLNSDVARRIKNCLSVPSGEAVTVSLAGGSLREFPVLIPKRDDDFYKRKFLAISAPQEHFYSREEQEALPSLENQLVCEIIQNLRLNNQELIEKQIQEDISELSACYSAKAYKAAVIMAGSILEAVLIDWLSELKGINYFEKSLKKRKYDKDKGEFIYTGKDAVLEDYINEIEDIKKPDWTAEAKKAHDVRSSRNLVHAKLCLKKQVHIDEETCSRVIDELIQVIKSRGVIVQKNAD